MNTAAAENDNAFALSLTPERKLELPEKKDFLDPLLHALDAVIYLYFAALYMSDQLSLLLLLRLANHFRSPSVAQLPPTILVSVICVATHLLQSREIGKRMYGGILIDFVGELAPHKTRLLILDTTVFALQLVMLVVGHEKQLASGGVPVPAPAEPSQDLESEEAGQLRSRAQDEAIEGDEGIEMQSLLPDGAGEEGSAHRKQGDPGGQDEDVIILDMKRGLKTLMRRPPATASSVTDSSTARVSLAFLSRVAAARARAA